MAWRAWARGRAARVARAIVIALAFVELAWLIVANVLLAFQLPARLAIRSDNVKFGYARAWSLYPGHLRVRGFWAHVESSGHRVDVDVDLARAGFDLWALTQRRFRTHWLEGRGVAVRVHADNLAPRGSGNPSPSPPRWSADLENVELRDVRELKVDWARLHGIGRIRGRAFLSAERIDAGPIMFDMGTAQLHVRDQLLGDWMGVHGRVTLSPFDPRKVSGDAILERLSGRADIRGNVAGLEALDSVLPHLSGHGMGDMQASLVLVHGALTRGTTAELHLHDARFSLGPATFAGALDAHARIKANEGVARVRLERLEITVQDQPSIRVHDGGIDLTAHFAPPSFKEPLPPARASLAVHDVRLDLTALSVLLPPPLEIRLGEATLDGSFALGKRTQGKLRLETAELVPSLAGHSMRADLEADVNVQAVSIQPLALDLGGTSFELHTGGAAELDGLLGWWVRGTLDSAMLQLEPQVRADVSASLVERDGLPWLSVLRLGGHVPPEWAHALSQPGLTIELDAHTGERTLALTTLRARGPNLALDGGLRIAETVDGAFQLRTQPPVGIVVRQGALQSVDRPDRSWLRSQLDVLEAGLIRVPAGHHASGASGRRSARR